eukprot:gene29344-21798_t
MSAGPAEGGGAADAEGGKRKREADPKELAGDQLSTLLEQIGDFTPTIPPAVIEYYLTKCVQRMSLSHNPNVR